MAVLPIVVAPDPILKRKADPVEAVTPDIARLMDDMLETMYAAPGIGLAAPQVGVSKRVLVMDVAGAEEEPRPIRMANPEILRVSEDTKTYEEGCLSFPDQFSEVRRPASVTLRYLDETGATREMEADGLLAVCAQHEIDHLDGVVFVDHLSSLKRGMILRKLKKLKRTGQAAAE